VEAVTGFIRRTYPMALLQWMGKGIVVVVFIFYTILSAWGVSRLEESFQLESVIPPESYYSKHLQVSVTMIIIISSNCFRPSGKNPEGEK